MGNSSSSVGNDDSSDDDDEYEGDIVCDRSNPNHDKFWQGSGRNSRPNDVGDDFKNYNNSNNPNNPSYGEKHPHPIDSAKEKYPDAFEDK